MKRDPIRDQIEDTWYVGAQNDGLFVIDAPPRPSTDDINPDASTAAIAKVYQHPDEDARAAMLAAAPEMLALLRRAVAGRIDDAWLRDARRAIAKAAP